MYYLSVWDDVSKALVGAFRSLMMLLCEIIYKLIVFCFNIFEKLGTAKLLDNDTVTMLYEKIGLLLGIYMIFRLIFVAVKYVVDPDSMLDKQKGAGKIVTKAIIVVVLLGVTPFIFDTAYKIQNSVVEENVIAKVILSTDGGNSDNFGADLAWYLFSTFFKDISNGDDSVGESCIELRGEGDNAYDSLIQKDFEKNSSLKYAYNCLNKMVEYREITASTDETTEAYLIEFDGNGLVPVLVGMGALYIIIMYTISVGLRVVQMAFLQLIAPIPIMMYLEPKEDGPFQKWVKMCVSCYLDFFIRTAIIYFVIFLINGLMDADTSYFFETLGSNSVVEKGYVIVIMIFALLMFAKKVPELIKEIMPSGGGFSDYGFSFKKMANNMVGGSLLNKGYDKISGLGGKFAGKAAKAIGLMPLNASKRLGKNIISGVDSARHGKGFLNGFRKNPGPVRQWVNKQRELLTPEGYKASQEKIQGRENVSAINDKWNRGAKLVRKLIGTGRFGKQGEKSGWDKALDGKTEDNYKALFRHREFIKSKMAVDSASNKEEKLRYIQQAISSGSTENYEYENKVYNRSNSDLLAEDLDKAQKTLNGVKEIHAEISKQYQEDARTEQEFKFIKNNSVNPADLSKNVNDVEELAFDETLKKWSRSGEL